MVDPTDLDADDRLLYLVGVTTRWHVLLEQAARHVFTTLVAPTPGVYLAPRSASQLLTDCKLMLMKADIGEDLRTAGSQTLDAALEANQERNRLVHDLFRGSDQEATWTAVRQPRRGQLGGESRTVSLRDVESSLEALRRCEVRVSMLAWGLRADLPFFRGAGDVWPPRAEVLAYLRDQFSLGADGGTRTLTDS